MNHKPIKLSDNTIFVGCTHIDHVQPFIWQKRGFKSVQEHGDFIIREIATYAKANPGAEMVHLGDGFLNSTPDRARSAFAAMGLKIHYIWGNHESAPSQLYKSLVAQMGFKIGEVYPLELDNVTFHGYEKFFSINNQTIFTSHFPHAVWDKSHHGIWHIHSHCHGSFKESLRGAKNGKRLDVGVDCNIEAFQKPYITFKQLKAIMDWKDISIVDHHNSSTT